MGEKNGGMWLIVMVVVLSSIMITTLVFFYGDVAEAIGVPLMDNLNEAGIKIGKAIGGMQGGGEPPVAE